MKIIAQNMQNYIRSGKQKFYEMIKNDNRKLVRYIIKQNPTVIVFSEVNKALFNEKWLSNHGYILYWSKKEDAEFTVLVAVKGKKEDSSIKEIPNLNGEKNYENRHRCVNMANSETDIIAVHLPPGSKKDRGDFFRKIFDFFNNGNEDNKEKRNIVLCGDFNCDTDDDSAGEKRSNMYDIVSPYRNCDVYEHKVDKDEEKVIIGENVKMEKATWQNPNGVFTTRIDRVFLTDRMFKENNVSIDYDLFPTNYDLSDHKMVVVEIIRNDEKIN